MILYQHSSFGFKSLTRVQGSAVCKAILPALLSTVILIVAVYGFDLPIKDNGLTRVTRHPYAIQAVIAFFTFLITFRANFAYHRVSASLKGLCSIQRLFFRSYSRSHKLMRFALPQ